jgi:hypothetical protein
VGGGCVDWAEKGSEMIGLLKTSPYVAHPSPLSAGWLCVVW